MPSLSEHRRQAEIEAAAFVLPPHWQDDRELVTGLAIDGHHTRDVDDAFHLTKHLDGSYQLDVSISDTSTLSPTSSIVRVAEENGESRYVDNLLVRPMIPFALCERALSLLDNEERPAITTRILLGPDAVVRDVSILKTTITTRRATYDGVNQLLAQESEPTEEQATMIVAAQSLASVLHRNRLSQGAKDYYTPQENVVDQERSGVGTAEHIVGEFAILANTVMARYFADNDIAGLYRVYGALDPKLENHYEAYMQSGKFEEAELLLRQMDRATYTTLPGVHTALGVEMYMRSTSPLRRFADMVAQLNLSAHFKNQPLPYTPGLLEKIASHLNGQGLRRRGSTRQSSKVSTHIEQSWQQLLYDTPPTTALPDAVRASLGEAISRNQFSPKLLVSLLERFRQSPNADLSLRTDIGQKLGQTPAMATTIITMLCESGTLQQVAYSYDVISTGFRATIQVQTPDGLLHSVTSIASNKNAARHAASAAFIGNYYGIKAEVDAAETPSASHKLSYKSLLQLLASKERPNMYPWYVTYQLGEQNGRILYGCTMTVDIPQSKGRFYTGEGLSKTAAEIAAAGQALYALTDGKLGSEAETVQAPIDYISQINIYVQRLGHTVEYVITPVKNTRGKATGEFTCMAMVASKKGDTVAIVESSAQKGKTGAKQAAARLLCKELEIETVEES